MRQEVEVSRVGVAVILDELSTHDEDTVRTMAQVLGLTVVHSSDLQVHAGSTDGTLALVGTSTAAAKWRARGARTLHLGQGGALRLPEEDELLLDLLRRHGGTRGAPCRRLMVARWHTDVDEAALAHLVARVGGAVLVDLRGRGPGHIPVGTTGGVRWADLDPDERCFPSNLAEHFPLVRGVPVLGADARGGARADEPLVDVVLEALAVPVVMDVGEWDERAWSASAEVDAVLLVGRGSRAASEELCAALALWPPAARCMVVTRGRRWPLMPSAAAASARVGSGPELLFHRAPGRLGARRWAGQLWRSIEEALGA